MSKPYIHAQSSAKKYGGKPEDYEKIHEWFDQTKAFLPDQRHRAILHSSFGIFLCSQVFGNTIKNSAGKVVSVRDIGEQHVLEDFGGKFIPTAQDYLQEIEYKDWMQNGKDYPPSFQKVRIQRKEEKEKKAKELILTPPTAEYAVTDGMVKSGYFPPMPVNTAFSDSAPKSPNQIPRGSEFIIDGGAGEKGGCRPIMPFPSGADMVVDGSRNFDDTTGEDMVFDGRGRSEPNHPPIRKPKEPKDTGADRLID